MVRPEFLAPYIMNITENKNEIRLYAKKMFIAMVGVEFCAHLGTGLDNYYSILSVKSYHSGCGIIGECHNSMCLCCMCVCMCFLPVLLFFSIFFYFFLIKIIILDN